MVEATQIHVVQVQDSHGHWDIHGAAFIDEGKCREFVANLDIEWIMENVPDHVILEALLEVPEEDLEEHGLGIGAKDRRVAIEAALRKVDRNAFGEFFDANEHGQIGGVYSWETVEIKDGLDIHTGRKTG